MRRTILAFFACVFICSSGIYGRDGIYGTLVPEPEAASGDTVWLDPCIAYRGSLYLENVHGTEDSPVVVSSRGWKTDGVYAHIDASGELAGIVLENCSNVVVQGIRITADGRNGRPDHDAMRAGMRCGVLCLSTGEGCSEGIVLDGLLVEDVHMEDCGYSRNPDDVNTANGKEPYGWGIRFISSGSSRMSGLTVDNCIVRNVSHTGIKFSGNGIRISRCEVRNCTVQGTGGPGIQMSSVADAHIHHNVIDRSGSESDTRNWGRGSGFWCWGSERVLFEYNRMTNANGPNDSAGAHIDYNCRDVIYQYNFSANNSGGFCEILGTNYNCCYRYNISVNDGQRDMSEDNVHYGYSVFVTGYIGRAAPKGPFNTYIYNNTVYAGPGTVSRIAVTGAANGLLVANNIFYVMGMSEAILDKQFKGPAEEAVMKRNLFLSPGCWDSGSHLQDISPVFGDPGFACPGGLSVSDYIPSGTGIRKRGIRIKPIEGDSRGLFLGLDVYRDILGRKVGRRPWFGAVSL